MRLLATKVRKTRRRIHRRKGHHRGFWFVSTLPRLLVCEGKDEILLTSADTEANTSEDEIQRAFNRLIGRRAKPVVTGIYATPISQQELLKLKRKYYSWLL